MQTEQTAALTNTPAIVLALVLLGAMAVASVQVAQYVLLAPGTLLPATPSKPVAQLRPAAPTGLQPSEAFTEMASGPGWETLSTPQKLALYPLAERWAVLSESQKRRWLALAQTFETLPPEEQEKLHNRMTEWSSLSARQRSQARLNYADAQRLAPNDKRAHWEAYQALSDEEKRSLAADAPTKPAGAAPALRPESPKKLVQVPAATQAGPARAHQRSLPQHQQHPLWWRRPRFPRLRPPPPRCLRCRAVRLHRSPHQPLHCNPGRKILATSRSDPLQACLLFPNPAPPSHRPPPSPASFKHPVLRGGWHAGCTRAF